MVAVLHLDIRLGKEAENLREQVAFVIRDFLGPVPAIFAQRHFLGNPVDLLLAFPEIISPRIFERLVGRSEEHTSELQSLMRISYAVFCLKKKKTNTTNEMRTSNCVKSTLE